MDYKTDRTARRNLERILAEKLANIVRLRNILAHQYIDIKWDYLKKFADTYSKDVEKPVEIVDNFINL
ncbi:HepT-like ribonuclease domain-containing protein [Calorimonas adulescens]|uniref:HepT-like ribonuclease domain-containing protein n=1 Tax=Calorimonas adulescens TaxID=2606906 RepID=UPI003B8480F5